MNLTKKLGPLPIWAWGVLFGVAGYFLYERYKSSSSSTTSAASVLDPNAVDPNTGLTYGEEESAALNADASQLGAGGGSGSVLPTDSGAQSTVPPVNEFGDFLTFLGEFSQIAQAFGWQPPASATSNAAASSPPVQGSSPPTTTPAANTSPAQTGIVKLNAKYLAAGVKSPSYQLTPPKNAPANAKWAGPNAPGKNWKGIGGGWWVPK